MIIGRFGFRFGFRLVCQRNEYFPHVTASLVSSRGPGDRWIEYLQRKERPTIGKLRWVHNNQMELVCVFLLSASSESEAENLEAQPQSTVRPEEIPPIPENRFLMRKSPPKADEKERKNREREREREWYVNMFILRRALHSLPQNLSLKKKKKKQQFLKF